MNRERKRRRVEWLRDEGIRKKYRQRVGEALNDEWENVNGDANAEVFETFKNVLLGMTQGLVGMKVGKKKGNAWWMEEVTEALREKERCI